MSSRSMTSVFNADDSSSMEGDDASPPGTVEQFGQPLCACKWCLPAFCFMVCAYICMWFLHIGAFYYIHEMERMEAIYVVNQTALAEWNGKFLDVDGSSFLS